MPISKSRQLERRPTLSLFDLTGVIRREWTGGPRDVVLETVVEELVGDAETAAKK